MSVLNLPVSVVYVRHSPQIYGAVAHERKINVDPLPPNLEEAPEPLHENRPFRHDHAGPWLPPRAGAGCSSKRATEAEARSGHHFSRSMGDGTPLRRITRRTVFSAWAMRRPRIVSIGFCCCTAISACPSWSRSTRMGRYVTRERSVPGQWFTARLGRVGLAITVPGESN
jgi:hypothetical protein